ncbi:MAG: hypothetical protein HY231_06400 [Acidobacteria bacterium]|nr:hypothetical protein [Acidobacteriota bacterium]
MKDQRFTDEKLGAFLLRQLPEAESAAIEAQFFADAESFERVCEVENQLVDRYVRGQLSHKEQGLFERHYLVTPARRQKVAFAKALVRATSQVQTAEARQAQASKVHPVSWWQALRSSLRSSSWLPQMAMAMAVILLIGSLWAVVKINALRRDLMAANQQRDQVEQRQQELNRQIQNLEQQVAEGNTRSEELAQELAELRRQREELERQPGQRQTPEIQPPAIASFLLLPGSVRGNPTNAQTLVIAHATATVQLHVQFESHDYPLYQAQVRAIGGAEVFRQQGLKARPTKTGATVTIRIPASKLARNDYLLTLSGVASSGAVEAVESYFFRVKNK